MKLVKALITLALCAGFIFFLNETQFQAQNQTQAQTHQNLSSSLPVIETNYDESNFDVGNLMKFKNNRNYTKKKMAVIVPYRNALEDIIQLVPHLTKFLNKQQIPFHIFCINQMDLLRFNRATLINVGFLYIKDKFDYMVSHDGDLLPLNPKLSYEYPQDIVYHVAANYLHPHKFLDADPAYTGGIVVISNHVYEKLDGMWNNYWGWGKEDEEFRNRIYNLNYNIHRPPKDIGTGKQDTFIHTHNSKRRPRDVIQCKFQMEMGRQRLDENTSLRNTKFKILGVNELTIDGAQVSMVNVELFCNITSTPWCDPNCPVVGSLDQQWAWLKEI